MNRHFYQIFSNFSPRKKTTKRQLLNDNLIYVLFLSKFFNLFSNIRRRKSRSAPMNGRVYPSTRLRLPHRPSFVL